MIIEKKRDTIKWKIQKKEMKCEREPFMDRIESSQRRWPGHVGRMDPIRIAQKCCNWKSKGRTAGRPRKKNKIEEWYTGDLQTINFRHWKTSDETKSHKTENIEKKESTGVIYWFSISNKPTCLSCFSMVVSGTND